VFPLLLALVAKALLAGYRGIRVVWGQGFLADKLARKILRRPMTIEIGGMKTDRLMNCHRQMRNPHSENKRPLLAQGKQAPRLGIERLMLETLTQGKQVPRLGIERLMLETQQNPPLAAPLLRQSRHRLA
jgi:hypothetical protein